METLNKNWFIVTVVAAVFGTLGYLLGKQQANSKACPMMENTHETLIDGDQMIIIPEVKVGKAGERIIVIPPPPPPVMAEDTLEKSQDKVEIKVIDAETKDGLRYRMKVEYKE